MASLLLQVKAVKLSPQEPYTWASGWKSPIYCNNRITLSFPEIRTFIKEQFSQIISQHFPDAQLIAGVMTAGIPHAALLADQLHLPLCYAGEAGEDATDIAGHGSLAGQKAVLLEDLISTGGSSLKAVTALRSRGVIVVGLAAIFTYGFSSAEESFKKAECPFYTLTDYDAMLAEALTQGFIRQQELDTLRAWRQQPDKWKPQ